MNSKTSLVEGGGKRRLLRSDKESRECGENNCAGRKANVLNKGRLSSICTLSNYTSLDRERVDDGRRLSQIGVGPWRRESCLLVAGFAEVLRGQASERAVAPMTKSKAVCAEISLLYRHAWASRLPTSTVTP